MVKAQVSNFTTHVSFWVEFDTTLILYGADSETNDSRELFDNKACSKNFFK